MERPPPAEEVATRWPETVASDRIDRQALGRIVFADHVQLEELESITHPHIFGTITSLVNQNPGPVVVEIPLLENKLGAEWRRLIVDASDETRLASLVDRGMTDTDARARMAAQPSRSEWLAIADLVVPNHGSLDELAETVARAKSVM